MVAAVLMELSHQMSILGICLGLDWVPRLQNVEADALTNSDFRHFEAENRIDVDTAPPRSPTKSEAEETTTNTAAHDLDEEIARMKVALPFLAGLGGAASSSGKTTLPLNNCE